MKKFTKKQKREMLFWSLIILTLVSWGWVGDPIPFLDEILFPILAYYYKK